MKGGSESDGDAALEDPTVCRSRRRITFPAQVSFQCAVQQQDNVELVRHLDQHGPRLDINAINHSGVSLLQQAVLNRNLDTVKILLCAGADVTAQDMNGNTALHSAASSGFRQAASLLIIFGADMFHLTYEGDMPVDLAKDNATVEMLTVEMRRQLQNQVFLDQYGFIFRAIDLWERFLTWSKAALAQAASTVWSKAMSQYQQLREQQKEGDGKDQNAIENNKKNNQDSHQECLDSDNKGRNEQVEGIQKNDEGNLETDHENVPGLLCNLSESEEPVS